MDRTVIAAIVLALTSTLAIAQSPAPPQPRDAAPRAAARTGTAVIRGRVFAADSGQPVRRAFVMLMPAGPVSLPPAIGGQPIEPRRDASAPPQPRNVATDASGRFEFTGLAAGVYRLRVMPAPHSAQYLGTAYGSRSAMEPGQAIELKDGQEFEANVGLMRGGAVTGRILDEMGEPVARVGVFVSRLNPMTGTYLRAGGGFIQSDDLGRYRVYGLEPGDYLVAAEARSMGGPPLEGVEAEGFVTTYHPSATQDREASRVRVRSGADAEGIDIQLVRTRTFRITGLVMDSKGQIVTRPNAQLAKQSPGGGFSSNGVSVDPQGRFTVRDVAPGEYLFVVRPGSPGEMMPPSASPPPATQQSLEYASVPLAVVADIENLVVVTQPAASVTGQVVFTDGAAENVNPASLRVTTQPGSRMMMMGPPPNTSVGADYQFTLSNLFGPSFIRLVGLRREWALRAVMLGTTDITDTPVEFKKEHSGQLQILVSTRAAAIEGVVTGDDGNPVDQAMVLILPEDKNSWRMGSPRMRTAISSKDGKFTAGGLIGGRYHAIALPYRTMLQPDIPPEFFESLIPSATRVVVSDDERRVVDLRLAKRSD